MKEYIVVLNENGHNEVVRCSNFKAAVSMYRHLCELYGPKCQIFAEVVGYGKAI